MIVNIALIFMFSASLYFICEKELTREQNHYFYITIAQLLLFYCVTFFLTGIYLALQKNITALAYVIFAFSPIILGKFSSYRKCKEFTLYQIFSLFISLIFLIYIINF